MLSKEVRDFLGEYIRTPEELEILLLLRRSPEKRWDVVDVAHELRLEPLSASNSLMGLYLKGLLGHEESRGRFYHYRYRAQKLLEQRLSRVADAFSSARTEVMDHIFATQRGALGAFSKAFALRKEK